MEMNIRMREPQLAKDWWLVALRGVAASVFGLLTLTQPHLSLAALVLMYGAYVLVDGVVSIIAAIRRRAGEPPRWLLFVEGVVSVAAAIITFVFPTLTAVVLLYVIAGWALITGVLEIADAIRLRNEIEGEWRLALSGALSALFGALLMIFPGAGLLTLVLWIGAFAVVFGALLIALALRLRRSQADVRGVMPRAA
jgi:uncharacterized membrane protein HdeD (DUF308 family)